MGGYIAGDVLLNLLEALLGVSSLLSTVANLRLDRLHLWFLEQLQDSKVK